jgi:hypothetical protein
MDIRCLKLLKRRFLNGTWIDIRCQKQSRHPGECSARAS